LIAGQEKGRATLFKVPDPLEKPPRALGGVVTGSAARAPGPRLPSKEKDAPAPMPP
jgi:hypothetical protein